MLTGKNILIEYLVVKLDLWQDKELKIRPGGGEKAGGLLAYDKREIPEGGRSERLIFLLGLSKKGEN